MALQDPAQLLALKKLMKRSKYGNKKIEFRGLFFDSKRECERYVTLRLLWDAGKIHNLERQMRFDLHVKDVKVCSYVADFVYTRNGKKIVEDCKGYRSRVYSIKKKMMKAIHGIEILET